MNKDLEGLYELKTKRIDLKGAIQYGKEINALFAEGYYLVTDELTSSFCPRFQGLPRLFFVKKGSPAEEAVLAGKVDLVKHVKSDAELLEEIKKESEELAKRQEVAASEVVEKEISVEDPSEPEIVSIVKEEVEEIPAKIEPKEKTKPATAKTKKTQPK